MNLTINIKAYFNLLVIVYLFIFTNFLSTKAISGEDDPENIIIDADKIIILDNGNEIQASGNIKIKTKNIDSTSDNSTYNKELNKITSSGKIIIKDKLNNHYYFDHFTTDKNFDNAVGSNVRVRMNDGSRIVGKFFSRQKSNFNQINISQH